MTGPLERLAALLSRLPGVGDKTATRLALALARSKPDYCRALARAISEVVDSTRECSVCCDLSTEPVCPICSDARRDGSLLCVVARPQDRMAFERAGVYRGRYHVLHGVLDPLSGVGPNQLRVTQLLERLRDGAISEVIVATSPTVEGDATALYLGQLLRPLGLRVTRISSGVAVGGELEYADQSTLSRALQDRRDI